MAQKKPNKPISAKERVRRSQEGKKRRATQPGEGFKKGANSAGHGVPVSRRTRYSPQQAREATAMIHDRNLRLAKQNPQRLAKDATMAMGSLAVGRDLTSGDIAQPPVRVRREAVTRAVNADKEGRWRTEPDVYTTDNPESVSKFWNTTAASSHKETIDKMMADPYSEFNKNLNMENKTKGKWNPAQRRRLERYTQMIQQGYPHEMALRGVSEAKQGRSATGAPKQTGFLTAGTARETQASAARRIGAQRAAVPTRTSRYVESKPRPHELNFGIGIATAQKGEDIRAALGRDLTDNDILQIQQAQNRQLLEEFQKNQLWAQETRRAAILGGQQGKRDADPDRVVVFTTSMGTPSVSVPSDSLMGQYVVRRRKKAMGKMGFTDAQLRGKFPQAVRDIHVLEAATGLEAGVQGDYGLYHRSGWRRGNRTSAGYGKPVPLGSQIMYDRQGRPMYDQAGNVRFSEGATRRFRKASKPLSLGVFVG